MYIENTQQVTLLGLITDLFACYIVISEKIRLVSPVTPQKQETWLAPVTIEVSRRDL
jgi:hypothetical protein